MSIMTGNVKLEIEDGAVFVRVPRRKFTDKANVVHDSMQEINKKCYLLKIPLEKYLEYMRNKHNQ